MFLDANGVGWNFSNRWLSADGKQFFLISSGINDQDDWNSIEGDFVTHGSFDVKTPNLPKDLESQ